MISNIFDEYANYTSDMVTWLKNTYQTDFSQFFDIQHNLAERMSNQSRLITDDELEKILLDVPLKLFSASEKLSEIQLSLEAIKLRIKEKEYEISASYKSTDVTYSAQEIKDAVNSKLSEDRIVLSAYSSLIARVEKELSYSRELIMGAKKVWDSRRRTDISNPISESSSSEYDKLPDYVPNGKTYIK